MEEFLLKKFDIPGFLSLQHTSLDRLTSDVKNFGKIIEELSKYSMFFPFFKEIENQIIERANGFSSIVVNESTEFLWNVVNDLECMQDICFFFHQDGLDKLKSLLSRLMDCKLVLEEIVQTSTASQSSKGFWKSIFSASDKESAEISSLSNAKRIELQKRISHIVNVCQVSFGLSVKDQNLDSSLLRSIQKPKVFITPEKENIVLSQESKQRLLSGKRKCSNRDLARIQFKDEKIICSYESKTLVILSSALTSALNKLFSALIKKIESAGYKVPQRLVRVRFNLRFMAAYSNILFFAIVLFIFYML